MSDEKTGSDFSEAPNAIDPVAERRLLQKLDWRLIPLFTLIYCTNFVDRTTKGNAKIAGIEKDLQMTGFDYNVALTVFYIFYIVAEVPSNLALKHFGSVWLAAMVVMFGAVAIGTAFVTSYGGLVVSRVFLGIAEGGTLSGLVYVLSGYYRRSELVLRVGVFFGVAPTLAGAFGGLLASGLLSVGNINSVTSWRKIFLIEGIITCGIGLACFFILPNDPQRTRMFNEEERALALARIDADQAVETQGVKEKTSLKLVLRSFSFTTTACAILYLLINISFQGLSLFMPTVVATLGNYTVVESQLRTVPPYLVGAVWAIFCSYCSFRVKRRAPFILLSTLLMVTGYAIAVGTKNSKARYAACFLSITGGSNAGPMVLAWGTGNAAPDTVKAVATALIPGIGTIGAVIAVWTYLPTDAPNYHNGNTLNLSTSSFTCVLVLLVVLYIRLENAKRNRGERNYRLEGKSRKEIEELGYLHPGFRYQV
ncbi:mfs transporter [Moniliophthora roreri MCA 2997]|uniref:Mfs transporter n=1 Tax=Moniliophthora roreri (strain MCA 2997) TaxID=1381753 RepID=V2XA29_MONRO|nr:mfs transporter [Moniliophthora roreri MCA 2997]